MVASLATDAVRREIRRAALLRCNTPLVTALLKARVASCRVVPAVVASLVVTALRTARTRFRTRVLTAWLRSRRFSLWRCRFSADL